MKISIVTFGCKVNQYESELMAESLEKKGHVIVPENFEADVYIVNSCAVTRTAERKVEREVRRIKREHPKSKIVLVGCYPQLAREIPVDVDLVLGNSEKRRIQDYLMSMKKGVYVDRAYWLRDGSVESLQTGFGDRTRAYIKIEDGCDRNCSYCAIRLARGTKIRSKPIEEALKEFQRLLKRGYKEIVITGINIGRYGVDTGEKLVDLLRELDGMPGEFRYRLSSLNPEDVNDEFLNFVSQSTKMCHHLHLSLQSGSDDVLKMMRRNYTSDDYLKIVDRLRTIDPDFSITTDVIVGFPGETEEDFERTLEMVEKVRFSRVHVFRFSPRDGTPASKMKDRIPGNVVKNRSEILSIKAEEIAKLYREKSIGKVRRVLIEKNSNGMARGYDEYYILHEFHTTKKEGFETVEIKSISERGVISRGVHIHR